MLAIDGRMKAALEKAMTATARRVKRKSAKVREGQNVSNLRREGSPWKAAQTKKTMIVTML